MSEELENSLRQAVETYLNDRLRAINEQVSRLQDELQRLRESTGNQSLEGTALSAAIFAHLQTARGQKLSGPMAISPLERDAAAIKRGVEAIEREQTQTEVLRALLKGAAQFTERVALFVIKNDQAIGWRVCKASDPENLDMIGGVSLPLNSGTIITRAAESRATDSVDSDPSGKDQLLLDQLGGQPRAMAAFPLIVRGKVVAILYADTSSEATHINSDALEVLARVASLAVNVVSIQRGAAPQREEAPPPAVEATPAAAEPVQETEPAYTPQVEPHVPAAEAVTETPVAEASEAAPVEAAMPEPPVEAAMPEPPVEGVAPEAPAEVAAPEAPAEVAAAPEIVFEPVAVEASPAPVVEAPPPAPSPQPATPFVSNYATPLGGTRRGVSEPELPIEVSEEERRLHSDARRFARLLVSEIKLYNEPKVKEGRNRGDLYDRLRDDIDRSRQMYDKRVAPPVAARHDYFHQELVNSLAEGDPNKLGGNYPGSALVSQ